MKRLHIALDIDGTLNTSAADFEIPLCEQWLEKRGLPKSDVHYDKVHIKDALNLDKKIVKEWMDYFFPINCRENPPAPGVPEGIRYLHQLGHKISIVTRRDPKYPGKYSGEEMVRDTKNWFVKFDIPYDEIYFGCKDKAKVLKEIKADIMVEDEELNILPIAKEGISCIIVAQPYNKECDVLNPNIIRVDGWPSIIRLIYNISMVL